MRMRKKKHLDERMQDVEKYILAIEGYAFYVKEEAEKYNLLDFKKIFGNDNKVHLEIGCGKGQFVTEMAKQNKDINFIAVEKLSNVIVAAAEKTAQERLENVRYLNIAAENLIYYFPKESVEIIYLNFSCPYPKKSYANRRLTNPKFLKTYREILVEKGAIYQKTDNEGLFEYSIESFEDENFNIKNVTRDLHNSDQPKTVITEYEQKFLDQDKPIYRLEAYK